MTSAEVLLGGWARWATWQMEGCWKLGLCLPLHLLVMTRSWNIVMTRILEHCDDKGHGAL